MKTALFAGSFDPITTGHEEIIRRSLGLFDKIILGIGINSRKQTFFSPDKRVALLEKCFEDETRIVVIPFDGLTVNFAAKHGVNFLLRGLRNGIDLEYEKPIALINKQLSDKLETVFLISTGATAHVSSTLVREVIKYKGTLDGLVPAQIIPMIFED